jgi:type IV secretion system protein VirD4
MGSFGDAHFCSFTEVQQSGLIAPTLQDNGVYLGRFVDAHAYYDGPPPVPVWYGFPTPVQLTYRGKNNIVTIAPSRAGKGTSAIIPTLLSCTDSMFVLDLKGENWFVTAPTRQSSQRIILINPFNIWQKELGYPKPLTNRFNPLADLDPAAPNFVPDINRLVNAMIVVEGKEPFFSERARQLVSCLVAHVCSPTERQAHHDNLPYVRLLLALPDTEFIDLLLDIYRHSPVPLASLNAGSFIDTLPAKPGESKTYSFSKTNAAVRATAIGQLAFLEVPGIIDFLSGNDFDFSQLRSEPMTIYCMIPPDMLDTYYRFARLMVQCFFNKMAAPPAATDRPVLALLDEQAKLRHMEIIETSVAYLCGLRVRVWSIFQDVNQIKSIYGENWETFISNAGILQVMTPNDATTADYISRRTGSETITEFRSSSNTPARHPAAPHTGGSTGSSEHVFARPLLSPQQLYAMPADRSILLQHGNPNPILTTRERYFEQPTFYGIPYAPHPVEDKHAFSWMRDYFSTFAR